MMEDSKPNRPSARRLPWAWFLAILLLTTITVGGWLLFQFLVDPLRYPKEQWRVFLQACVTPDGRVIDTGNSNISHSEGQGYAMLVAEAMGDRRSFDRIWSWTKSSLQVRPDHLFAWKWEPHHSGRGGITDLNNASDADLFIAWALWRASERWKNEDYAREAKNILYDLKPSCFRETTQGFQLLPGAKGFLQEDGEAILNPSYYVFSAFRDLSDLILAEDFSKLTENGMALIEKARFGKFELSPDWVVATEKGFSLPEDSHLPAVFGYNAVRIPLYIGWFDRESTLLDPFAGFWNSLPPEQSIPATVVLPSGQFSEYGALPGVRVVADFTKACVAGAPFEPEDVPPLETAEVYYSAILKLLTMVAAKESSQIKDLH